MTAQAIREGARYALRPHGATAPAMRLTYAIAPPSRTMPRERRQAVAAAASARISALPIDALLVYDVQDETSRNDAPRPFPFAPKVDALDYAFDAIEIGALPRVVYRAVAEQDEASLCRWLDRLQTRRGLAVLVGAPSSRTSTSLSLPRAFGVCRRHTPLLPFGGVTIPERHQASADEHTRVLRKMQQGCSFFVSQTVWSIGATQRLLRDLQLRANAEGALMPPILLTFSPCGSPRTLEFLEWLGVAVPAPVKRQLLSAKDMLAHSIDLATQAFAEIRAFATARGISVGCNVESVSSRADEVAASVELVRRIDQLSSSVSMPHPIS